jgi:hypothetical protein
MNRNTRARIAGLCLMLSATAVAAFAAPPAPQPCTCEYCSHAPSNRSCVFDGTTTTCGSFLAVTLCLPQG